MINVVHVPVAANTDKYIDVANSLSEDNFNVEQ